MPLIECIGLRHKFLVPSVVSGFVATEKQQSHTARIESIQHSNRFPAMLHPQFAHMREARGDDRFAVPIRKGGAELFQQVDIPVDAVCSDSPRPSNQSPNSSVYSTSHAIG